MIEPDTKDWTWVLTRPCPECGFDTSKITLTDVPALLRSNAASWTTVLAAANSPQRPHATTWSPLEYACHVRDCCRVYTERLHLMRTTDDPRYPDWDQDAAAIDDHYAQQDPRQVAEELAAAAENLAAHFAQVSPDEWHRTGTRGDGAHFTIDTFARYFIHDPIHHLHDVGGGAGTSPAPA